MKFFFTTKSETKCYGADFKVFTYLTKKLYTPFAARQILDFKVNKMNLRYSKVIQAIAIFFIGIFVGLEINQTPQFIPETTDNEAAEINTETSPLDLSDFWTVYDVLKENYYDATVFNTQIQTQGAIKGLVNSLGDNYTSYMDPQENIAFEDSLKGEFEGIGAELSIKNSLLVVVSPLKNSPAEEAGLQPGDIIYKIGEKLAGDLTLFEAVMQIRGPKNSYIALTILREGEDEALEMSIMRDKIDIPNVEYKDLGSDIYSIQIYQFGDDTETEFSRAVQELILKNPKGLIVDLRANGGGYVDAAINVLSEFVLGEKESVKIKYREETKSTILYTKADKGRLSEIPVAVLINAGSASASEIVAGAIQDWKRGVIIGEQSFGKGSVQELYNLKNGGSLRMTVAKWFTPNDRSIQDEGISPDIVVEITKEDIEAKKDPQMEKAIEVLK